MGAMALLSGPGPPQNGPMIGPNPGMHQGKSPLAWLLSPVPMHGQLSERRQGSRVPDLPSPHRAA